MALGFFAIIQHPQLFQANILSVEDEQIITHNDWEFAYRTDSGVLDTYLSAKIVPNKKLYVEVLFDPDRIVLDCHLNESQADVQKLYQSSGECLFSFDDFTGFDYEQSLFVLDYTGDASALLV
ncbi:MAG: hypothetical protein GXP45_07075 [bacterium]|nr:hypothetical protein [bacterium]